MLSAICPLTDAMLEYSIQRRCEYIPLSFSNLITITNLTTSQPTSYLQGIEVGDVDLVLHVRPCEGLVRQLDGTVEKRFAKKEIMVPLQVQHNPKPYTLGQPKAIIKVFVSSKR